MAAVAPPMCPSSAPASWQPLRDVDPTDTTPRPIRLRRSTPSRLEASVRTFGERVAVVVADRPDVPLTVGLGAADGDALAAGATLAREHDLPLVLILAAGTSEVTDGLAALHAWGVAARAVAACSGVVPVVAVVTGPAVSGPSLVLGLADLVVVTAGSRTYVSGPHAVRNVTGLAVSADQLGGASVHATRSGLAAAVADDPQDAMAWVEDLLACLPPSNNSLADDRPSADPADRPTPELRTLLPEAPTGSYDVREVLRSVVDDADLLELRPHWAPNLITAFAAVGGIRVGLVANQPCQLAGTLDIVASQKGARFVAMCDAFGLPLVTVVDTPGFSPGKDLEWRGMIRKGAQLAFAYARATVPRVNLTLRKSYGGAYIVMDSKRIGNDVALAWPSAEIAVMGARGAVEILHRKASPEERIGLEADYEQRLLNPYVAAERGLIDAVIDPGDTRREVAAALAMLASKREHLPPRAHDNSPL